MSLTDPALCDVAVGITSEDNGRRLPVYRTGRVCLQCFNAHGNFSGSTSWRLSDGSVVRSDLNQAPAVAMYASGVLVLFPGVVGNGSAGEYGPVSCFSTDLTPGYSFSNLVLYSEGI